MLMILMGKGKKYCTEKENFLGCDVTENLYGHARETRFSWLCYVGRTDSLQLCVGSVADLHECDREAPISY